MAHHSIPFVFFGSSRFSVIVLDTLVRRGYTPTYIVSTPDKPQGRKMLITPNIVTEWARTHSIPCITPSRLDASVISTLNDMVKSYSIDVFVVASYGKIIPETVLNIPRRHTLNIHPSLLPRYRGASPLQSAILDDAKDTGISIMRIDEEMDHGPIVSSVPVHIDTWPVYEDFEAHMAEKGAELLADMLPEWIAGHIPEHEQQHDQATYTKKIKKEDGLINLHDDAYTNFRKIQAYHEWPTAYFMHMHKEKPIRVKITEASYTQGSLVIQQVIPEGGKEMSYTDFLHGYSR